MLTTAASYFMPTKATSQTKNYEVRKIAVVDRKKDGNSDIVFVGRDKNDSNKWNTNLMYLENQGKGKFSQPKEFEQQLERPYNLFKGKLTNDNLEDIVVIEKGTGSNNGGLYFSKNSNGTFDRFERLPEELQNPKIWAGVMADLDGDGKEDMVAVANSDIHFTIPSTIIWARNITSEDSLPDYRGVPFKFESWKKLQIVSKDVVTDYEIAFTNYGLSNKVDALSLAYSIDNNRNTAKDRRGFFIYYSKEDRDWENPDYVMEFSGNITQKFGFVEDVDLNKFKGKKGVFCVFRKGLRSDGTSNADEIYFVEKKDAQGKNAQKQATPFLQNPPQKLF